MYTSLFSLAIQTALVPEWFIILNFKRYSGVIVLWYMFNIIAESCQGYQQDDVLLCKIFPACLEKGPIAYFQQLPHGSVTTFAKHSAQFRQAYEMQIQELKRTDSLFQAIKHS